MNEDPREEPSLFDLPLAPPAPAPAPGEEEGGAAASAPARRSARRTAAARSLSLFGDEEPPEVDPGVEPPASQEFEHIAAPPERRAADVPLAGTPRGPVGVPAPPVADFEPSRATASLGARLQATGGDLAILAAVLGVAALGVRALDAPLGAPQLAPLGLFLLAFSFLYSVIPLAFWGQTPGMIWAGVVARSEGGEALSFAQTTRRWAGTWLAWGTLGLLGLLGLTGRSLADRWSRSELLPVTEALDAARAA